ncbi:MAG TPA: hypothetical protein VH332_07075 [Nitrospira sp.]|jgi:hypothetical protein
MKSRFARITALLLIGSFALGAGRPAPNQPPPTPQQTQPSSEEAERESLRGIVGVEVLVDPLDSEIEQAGLSTDKLQEDIRQRIHKAGVKVLTERERLANPATAVLIVRVDTLHDRIGRYFYSADLLLTQRVKLQTRAETEVSAVTWKKLGTVSTVADDNVKHLEDQVLRKVDQFTKDYLAVNSDRKVKGGGE